MGAKGNIENIRGIQWNNMKPTSFVLQWHYTTDYTVTISPSTSFTTM